MFYRKDFYRFWAMIFLLMEIGTVGALECDNIGIKQALIQLAIFCILGFVSALKGGLFNDNM